MTNVKDLALIVSLCKDIARHASQIEAESKGQEQSAERYLELKKMLVGYYAQGDDKFKTILEEIRKSIRNAGSLDKDERDFVSTRNHALCMLEYFLMLTDEANKD